MHSSSSAARQDLPLISSLGAEQSSTKRDEQALPPPQSSYVFRGHSAAVHCVQFIRGNERLLTGDADGWVISWDLVTRRAATSWKPHEGSILGLSSWGSNNIITQGRDFHLRIWQLGTDDEANLSKVLPTETSASDDHKSPWLVYSLRVQTLNFCAFSLHAMLGPFPARHHKIRAGAEQALVATPGSREGEVQIFHLPSQREVATVPNSSAGKTGMLMAVHIMIQPVEPHGGGSNPRDSVTRLVVTVGYESGRTSVFVGEAPTTSNNQPASEPSHDPKPTQSQSEQDLTSEAGSPNPTGSTEEKAFSWSDASFTWHEVYTSAPHSQPVLSLDISPTHPIYYTSSADDKIVAHPIPTPDPASTPPRSAGTSNPPSNLSKLLASATFPSQAQPSSFTPRPPQTAPLHTNATHHPGQQSLRVRSDGLLLATAGWDGRARVYSAQSLDEVAVLKHTGLSTKVAQGLFAVDFAEVGPRLRDGRGAESGGAVGGRGSGDGEPVGNTVLVTGETRKVVRRGMVRARRAEKAKETHWVAVGGKDGRVSLWEIY